MFRILLLCLGCVVLGTGVVVAEGERTGPDEEGLKVHPFVADATPCAECHPAKTGVPAPEFPGHACATYCATCHMDLGTHHPTGAVIKEPPADLPSALALGRRTSLECFTCHDLHEPRYDSRPRRSQSLFDRLFRRSESYLTYYLPVSNTDGAMCRACH